MLFIDRVASTIGNRIFLQVIGQWLPALDFWVPLVQEGLTTYLAEQVGAGRV